MPGGEGGGGSIFWKTQDTALYSIPLFVFTDYCDIAETYTKHYCLRRMMFEYLIVQEQSANMDGDNPTNKKKNLQVKKHGFICMYILWHKQRGLNIKRHTLVFFLAPRNLSNHMDRQAHTSNTVLVKCRELTGRRQTMPKWLGGGRVKTTENKKHWPRRE